MMACKETAVLHFFALAAAALVFRLWNTRGKESGREFRLKPLVVAAILFLLLCMLLFTWFGRNWRALFLRVRKAPSGFCGLAN